MAFLQTYYTYDKELKLKKRLSNSVNFSCKESHSKILNLEHFNHHWFSTHDVEKIVRHVFNLPKSTKICSNSVLFNMYISCDPASKKEYIYDIIMLVSIERHVN